MCFSRSIEVIELDGSAELVHDFDNLLKSLEVMTMTVEWISFSRKASEDESTSPVRIMTKVVPLPTSSS